MQSSSITVKFLAVADSTTMMSGATTEDNLSSQDEHEKQPFSGNDDDDSSPDGVSTSTSSSTTIDAELNTNTSITTSPPLDSSVSLLVGVGVGYHTSAAVNLDDPQAEVCTPPQNPNDDDGEKQEDNVDKQEDNGKPPSIIIEEEEEGKEEDTVKLNSSKSSNSSLLRFGGMCASPDAAGTSLRKFTENFTDYLCYNSDANSSHLTSGTTAVTTAAGHANPNEKHRWPGNCICCYDCSNSCFDPCASYDSTNTTTMAYGPPGCREEDIESIRKYLEDDISSLMSFPGNKSKAWLNTFCDWVSTVDDDGYEYHYENIKSSEELRSMLYRNRSHVIRAQARKINRLRSQMHFAEPQDDDNVSHHHHDDDTHDYNVDGGNVVYEHIDNNTGEHNTNNNTVPLMRVTKSMERLGSGDMSLSLDDCETCKRDPVSRIITQALSLECITGGNKMIINSGTPSTDEDLLYDSDPGTYRGSFFRVKKKTVSRSHRSSSTNKPVPVDHTKSIAWFPSEEPSSDEGESLSSMPNNNTVYNVNSLVNIHDPASVAQFLHELTNGKNVLVWHPTRYQLDTRDQSPVCIHAWFEMGSRLKDKVIQPKFMWRSAYEPDLEARKKLTVLTPHSVELLNIVRVLIPHYLDRDEVPFAKTANSFTLHTNTEDTYVFECSSQRERDRFVHGLKLIVARLASKIIVGDEDVFTEFFTPWGNTTGQQQHRTKGGDGERWYGNNSMHDGSISVSSSSEDDDIVSYLDSNSNAILLTTSGDSQSLKRASPLLGNSMGTSIEFA